MPASETFRDQSQGRRGPDPNPSPGSPSHGPIGAQRPGRGETTRVRRPMPETSDRRTRGTQGESGRHSREAATRGSEPPERRGVQGVRPPEPPGESRHRCDAKRPAWRDLREVRGRASGDKRGDGAIERRSPEAQGLGGDHPRRGVHARNHRERRKAPCVTPAVRPSEVAGARVGRSSAIVAEQRLARARLVAPDAVPRPPGPGADGGHGLRSSAPVYASGALGRDATLDHVVKAAGRLVEQRLRADEDEPPSPGAARRSGRSSACARSARRSAPTST